MKEEELIKKLETVDLPEIELPSHQRWLRAALLSAGYPESQPALRIWDSVRLGIRVGMHIVAKGLASRQPAWKSLVIVVCVVALVALGNQILLSQERAGARVLVELSRLEVEALVNALSPGKTLYTREQTYRRHGPVAPSIMKGPWYVPESSYAEQWMQVDSDGNFFCFRSAVVDSEGKVWQESVTVDGEQVIRDVNSGEEIRSPSKPYPVIQYMDGVVGLPERLLEKGWEFVGNGKWAEGRRTAIFEKRESHVDRRVNLGQGYIIPWVADLNAVETIFRFEILVENPLFYSEEVWVADATGDRTLVERHRRTSIEVLDEPPPPVSCPPPDVAETFTLADADEVLNLGSLLPDRFERMDAASEGLSRDDLGLGPDWSEVYLYRSDDTDELVYAYLTIMPELAGEQPTAEIVEGLFAGIPEGVSVNVSNLAEILEEDITFSVAGLGEEERVHFGAIRAGQVFVALHVISSDNAGELVLPLAQQIQQRLWQYSP